MLLRQRLLLVRLLLRCRRLLLHRLHSRGARRAVAAVHGRPVEAAAALLGQLLQRLQLLRPIGVRDVEMVLLHSVLMQWRSAIDGRFGQMLLGVRAHLLKLLKLMRLQFVGRFCKALLVVVIVWLILLLVDIRLWMLLSLLRCGQL